MLATNGVAKLGGDDFDFALVDLVRKKYKAITGDDLDPEDFTKNDAEEEKKSLSKRKSVTVRVNKKMIDISKAEFEEAISTLVTQAELLCESAVEEADIEPRNISAVFLAGGSTRIPVVRESIKRVFDQEPLDSANVDEVVALGAALYAAYKGDRENLTAAQQVAIDKINVSETTSKCFGTLSLSHNEERSENELENSILIYKGDKIPTSIMESFYTAVDGQEQVRCRLTESTAPESDPKFVKIVWEGMLDLPPGRPAGQEIRITYAYDDNQIMKCSFLDVATSKKVEIDLSMSDSESNNRNKIEQFLVE